MDTCRIPGGLHYSPFSAKLATIHHSHDNKLNAGRQKMTEGTKTASSILAGVVKAKSDQITYDNLRKEFSDSFHTVLMEILTKSPQDSKTITHLIMDRKHELISGISHSPFPK